MKIKLELKDFVYLLIIFIIIVTSVLFFYFYKKSGSISQFNLNPISSKEASAKVMDFVDKQLKGQASSSLESITSTDGVYKLVLKINSKEVSPVYLSYDGNLLFPEAIDLTTFFKKQKKITCKDIPKVNNPELKAFVVSRCPYGLQSQRILADIIKNIPELEKNIRVEYLGYIDKDGIHSMHGESEAQENLRQICIREEQPSDYWKYVSCHIQKGEVDKCLSEAKVDTQKLKSCMSDNKKGLAYAQKDFADAEKYHITGSPGYVLDNNPLNEQQLDFGGRSSEAFKNLICCAFKDKPQFCSKTLNKGIAATYFSQNYSTSNGGESGSCQ